MVRRDLILGGSLIAIGILLLLRQILDLDLGLVAWPVFLVFAGVVLLVFAVADRNRWGGLAISGSMLTVTGALLLYQEATGLWATWAYAWALVFPVSTGLGLLLYGWLIQRGGPLAVGRRFVVSGLVLFALGAAFFEGVVGLSGFDLGQVGRVAFPAAIIGFGIVLLVTNGVFRRRSA